jgi:hypothetical protein
MVNVIENSLKLTFSVQWVDPSINDIEFKVIKCLGLYLVGMDENISYPTSGAISSDPTIAQTLFKDNLDPYGIVLNKIVVHSMNFFESLDFTFTDPIKLEELYLLINEQCKKIKHK